MKYILLAIVALSFSWKVNAQNPPSQTIPADSIHLSVDKLPQFPGGIQAFSQYSGTTLKYPKAAQEAHKEGMTIIGMIVEPDGSVTNVKIAKSSSSADLDAEAVRVVSASPKWIAGEQNGKKVRLAYALPVSFSLKKP